MTRTCARPGCGRAAVATLSYDYGGQVVWLEPLAPEPHPMVHDLCDRHAGGLRPPRGWELRDSRPAPPAGATVTPLARAG